MTEPTAQTPAAAPTPNRSFGGNRGGRSTGGQGGFGNRGGQGGGFGGNRSGGANRRPSRRGPAPRSEYEQKLLAIRRVARVAAGGRRFNFSVAVVIGNRKGSVGVGLGKAGDTALAIEKAVRVAKKQLIHVNLTKNRSIPHDVKAKYCASSVVIYPVAGKGLVAGSAIRDVLEFAGITDVNAKLLSGSKNKLNNARVAIKALAQVSRAAKAEAAPVAPAAPVATA